VKSYLNIIWGFVWVGTEACVLSGCTTPKPSSAEHTAGPSPTVSTHEDPSRGSAPDARPTDATLADVTLPTAPPVAPSSALPSGNSTTAQAPKRDAIHCPPQANAEAGQTCGELHCLAFSTESAAFEHILSLEPQVLGIGESHAPRGMEQVHSATRRFGELLLPSLCGRTKAIILELWLPRNDCGDKRVEQVKKAQEPVTHAQAKSNQDEYVTLGHVAKRLGIFPSALVPSCDEYQSILDAGPDSIERMLELVGKRSGERVLEELHKSNAPEAGPVVIAYGGALHNDAEPDREHEHYSYGPALLAATQGKYIELDLIVPEFVKDTEIWKRQPWYTAFKGRDVTKTQLYQWAPHSFALVFPKSSRPAK